VRDRERTAVVRRCRKIRGGLQHAEEVRLLEDHAGRIFGRRPESIRIRRAAGVRYLDDLEPEAGGVGLHDLAYLRVGRLCDDDLRPAGRVLGDVTRVRGDGRSVVARRVRDIHPRQLANDGLVFEDRL
jgi:hypothetical protein